MSLYKIGDLVPKIGENNFIAQGAKIIGDVETGNDVSIWYSTIVRADASKIKIGNKTNIQDNSTVHGDVKYPVTVGDNVTVGHNCVIHGCTIGDNVIIGMGSLILNGAKIGSNSIVAAGSVVRENFVGEDGVLIGGNPARVLRTLSEKNKEYIDYARDFYIKDIELYKTIEKIK